MAMTHKLIHLQLGLTVCRLVFISEELSLSGQSSPFFAGISGEISTKNTCEECQFSEIKQESFMSLNFKLLQEQHVAEIRKRFEEEGYSEGLVTKTKQNPSWSLFKVFSKKTAAEPILTIRDYLCYLNLIQTYQTQKICTNCKKKTSHTQIKVLQRAPEIFIVGFSESGGDDNLSNPMDFRLDQEFDISPFVNSQQNKYELLTVVTHEVSFLGIITEVIYFKGLQGGWLKCDLFGITEISQATLNEITRPQIVIYQKKLSPDTERKNLESNFELRDEFDGVELAPLPCFYMEEMKLLGIKPNINLAIYLCPHQKLLPVYKDLYLEEVPKDILISGEIEMLKKRAVRPERKLCKSNSMAMKTILVGTTLLPKPIVDYILEKSNSKDTVENFNQAWLFQRCVDCCTRFTNLKRRRLVEQLLFLKYDLADSRQDIKIPMDWAHRWYKYLFFDTYLFQESSISSNYPLPVPPEPFQHKHGEQQIDTNKAVFHIICRFYKDEPNPLSGIEPDIINVRDQQLIEKSLENKLDDDDIADLESRIKRLIEIRHQKVNLEGGSDVWHMESSLNSIESPRGKSRNEIKEPIKSGEIKLYPPITNPSQSNLQITQEFFDSDSEREEGKDRMDDILYLPGKDLSRIEEERTEQALSSYMDGGKSPFPLSFIGSTPGKDRRFSNIYEHSFGTNEKGHSDYVTHDAAMKNYLHKHLVIREVNRKINRTLSHDKVGSADAIQISNKNGNNRKLAHLHADLTPKNLASPVELDRLRKISAPPIDLHEDMSGEDMDQEEPEENENEYQRNVFRLTSNSGPESPKAEIPPYEIQVITAEASQEVARKQPLETTLEKTHLISPEPIETFENT